MSTFYPATSSLANFKNTISTISTSRFFVYISSHQDKNLRLSWHRTTHLLSSTRATNEGIAVLEVWSIFPFAIKRILGIKRIFPCSFANKRMHLLTVCTVYTCVLTVCVKMDVCVYIYMYFHVILQVL